MSEVLSWLARYWWLVAVLMLVVGYLIAWALFAFWGRWRSTWPGRTIHRTEEQLDREVERLEAHREEQREAAETGRAADHADVDDHWLRGGR